MNLFLDADFAELHGLKAAQREYKQRLKAFHLIAQGIALGLGHPPVLRALKGRVSSK